MMNYFIYILNVRKICEEILVKVNIGGKILEGRFRFLLSELKSFHLYHFEAYIGKWI